MIDKKDVLIILPAYNEGKVIAAVIDDIKSEGYSNILVIDDGSTDDTYNVATKKGVEVISHIINRRGLSCWRCPFQEKSVRSAK